MAHDQTEPVDAIRDSAAEWITTIISNFGVDASQAPILARLIVDGCGLVAIDPTLVERVAVAREIDRDMDIRRDVYGELADAVLAQVKP